MNACEVLPDECVKGFNARALELINQYRSEEGVAPISEDGDLFSQAVSFADHLCDLSCEEFLNETRPDHVSIALLADGSVDATEDLTLTAEYCASN